MDTQKKYQPQYSFEFYPPKTQAGAEKLVLAREKLATLNPRYFSVTFGAGGSTQTGTLETIFDIQQSGYDACPHLSCIGSTRENIEHLLQTYQSNDIKRIVALRGDMPSGMHEVGAFRHANELVAFIREQTGDHFHIEVAAYPEFHPQAISSRADLDNFKLKIEAGASSAITQYFFNPDAYYRFIEDCEKMNVTVPIVPGIMPITNYKQLARFSDMCGAEIPRWIRKRLESYGDDLDSIRAFGTDVISDMCKHLLAAGAPGLHFYTMNQSRATMAIWNNLGISN
ncbi:MAG TPA: methylenetetrahydrofolate reductase [NAD(P)H] [Gammaproteobacteria bacterium]|nr:methylenetetrahydrofolate reductase [NAD(P)H] [Gammaproteobacteria bacterium]